MLTYADFQGFPEIKDESVTVRLQRAAEQLAEAKAWVAKFDESGYCSTTRQFVECRLVELEREVEVLTEEYCKEGLPHF